MPQQHRPWGRLHVLAAKGKPARTLDLMQMEALVGRKESCLLALKDDKTISANARDTLPRRGSGVPPATLFDLHLDLSAAALTTPGEGWPAKEHSVHGM
eukprot:5961384-Pleurochrysis_carterae.AAC.1